MIDSFQYVTHCAIQFENGLPELLYPSSRTWASLDQTCAALNNTDPWTSSNCRDGVYLVGSSLFLLAVSQP